MLQRYSSQLLNSSSGWSINLTRLFASVAITASNPAEKDVAERLAAAFKGSKRVEVEDISGGCEWQMAVQHTC